MYKRLLIGCTMLLLIATVAHSDIPQFAPKDPGAARDDFSNVDPAVAFEALGLGSMSTASADDYYTKSELDATLGSISAALDKIIGAP